MLIFILRRLLNACILMLCIGLIGHWMIQNIPGSYDDMSREEDAPDAEKTTAVKTILPLFYFGFIPEKKADSIRAINSLMPEFKWNGTHNLYHRWLWHASESLRDGIPVQQKILRAIQWTMALQIPAVLLIFVLGLWLAFLVTRSKNQKFRKFMDMGLTALHAFPVFWFGSLLLIFFSNPDFFNWFPAIPEVGEGSDPFALWMHQPTFWILPIIALVFPSLAVIYNFFRKGLENAFQKRFWMRAKSSGISELDGLRHELIPHAMIPVLAWIASAVPFLISGSILIETIFSIPGSGRLLYNSIHYRDWPVVHGLFMLAAGMTLLGLLISDVCQRLMDPRLLQGEA
jgi:peptide/nickel transport system permease protein